MTKKSILSVATTHCVDSSTRQFGSQLQSVAVLTAAVEKSDGGNAKLLAFQLFQALRMKGSLHVLERTLFQLPMRQTFRRVFHKASAA